MAIYPSDNHLVLSWTSYCNFLLHDKPAPMNNLPQLATHLSSKAFINSGGFSKLNNKLGAKNLIALKVSGISVLIAMGIAIWPFRANLLWIETPLRHCKDKGTYLCPGKQSSLTFPCTLQRHIFFGAGFISCSCLKYFHWEKKAVWITWAFTALMADLGCVLCCTTATQHEMWVSHQNYRSSPPGNLPWQSSW